MHLFRSFTLLNILFRTIKAFFGEYYLQQKLITLPNEKIFSYFCEKTLTSEGKRHVHYSKTFDTHFTSNLPLLLIFLKKTKFRTYFRSSPCFSRILRQISFDLKIKILQMSKRRTSDAVISDVINWQIRVRNVHFEWMIFLP